ncbi:MAG: hypothetical protein JJU21_11035 [Salinarimonas sp.]|nr:hypothetical protein [Salinarimonas sp.]
MAYALNYPNAPTADAAADATNVAVPARKTFFQRLLASLERAQMRRFERELMLYAPHLYDSITSTEEYRKMREQDASR